MNESGELVGLGVERIPLGGHLYTVSQKRMLPNFGNNFVKSRPIFKILSLLETELNLKQKSHNMFTSSSTHLKKIHNCHAHIRLHI